MKINKLIYLFALIGMIGFSACEQDTIDGGGLINNSVYIDNAAVSIAETGSTTLTITRVTNDYSSNLTVSLSISAEFADGGADAAGTYTSSATSVTFGANESEAEVVITSVEDNAFTGDKLVTITISEASGYTIGTTQLAATSVVTIGDDDCPIPSLIGDFSVETTNTNPAGCEGVTNTVTIALVSDNPDGTTTYSLSDVTGGLYLNCYGSADNAGNVVVASDGLTVTLTAQPDVVYGGDQFDGTGVIDSCAGTLTLSWSNGFGDAGTTVFSL